MSEIGGIIVPLATPFDDGGEIDYAAFREEIAFMDDAKVHAIAVGGSTGEGHTLEHDELRRLCEVAIEAASGRIPVVGSIIVDSTREAIQKAKMLDELALAAVQITPVHYLFKPSADATVEHFRQIAVHTRHPMLIYNVVPWNYLSAELLVLVMTEVPAVRGVKQSHADLKLFADLMISAPRDKWIFTAVDALLYPSFALGAKGTISALPTALPRQCVALWDLVAAGRHAEARELHEKLLALWNAINGDNLPYCIKYVQHLQGVRSLNARAPMHAPSIEQKKTIEAALEPLGIRTRAAA